jgi:hypothetical protein
VCQPQLQRSSNMGVLQHSSEQLAVQTITSNRNNAIQLLQLLQAEAAHY